MGNNLKTTLTLAAAALLLTLYAAFFEQEEALWDQPVGAVFQGLKHDEVVELELIPGPGASPASPAAPPAPILLKYEPEGPGEPPQWHIVNPFSYPAFLPRVEGLVGSIVELQRLNTVSAGPKPGAKEPGPFEESAIAATLRFKTRGSQPAEHRLEVGRDYPVESLELVYVRLDGRETFLVRKSFKKTVKCHLDELRGRALFPVPKELAMRLEIRRAGGDPIILARPAGSADWRFQPPLRGIADRAVLDGLLDGLNAARIESFVDDQLKEPGRYGFEKPWLSVALTNRRGKVFSCEIAEDPKGELQKEVYVHRPEQPFLYTARKETFAPLDQPAEELRSRFVLQFGAEEIVGVEGTAAAAAGGVAVTAGEPRQFHLWKEKEGAKPSRPAGGKPLDRPKEEEERTWKVEDMRLKATYPADPRLTSEFLRALEALPVLRYLDDPGQPAVQAVLKGEVPPAVTLSLKLSTGAALGLSFHPAPQGEEFPEGSFLVKREGDEEIALLKSTIPQDLSAGGIYFRDRRISSLSPEAIAEFDIGDLKTTWNIALIGDAWRVGEDDHVNLRPGGKGLDQLKVRALLNLFQRESFRVVEFLPDQRNQLEALELVEGRFRLRITFQAASDSELGFRQLTIGAWRDQSPGQEYYARVDTIDMPILLAPEVVKAMLDLISHLQNITLMR